MRAVLYTQYGSADVLHVGEVAKPTPKPTEILVKIHATTVTIGDTIMRSLNIPGPRWQRFPARLYLGVFKPKRPILGMELAGDIEAVGSAVTRFKPGDRVFASTFAVNFGAHAEYKCLPETGVVAAMPTNLTYEQAAALPGAGMTALHLLNAAQIRPGQQVLIYGASGAVGTYAVQIAKQRGAVVTGVCSAANLELVQGLGADTVLDYTRPDFWHSLKTYAVVVDAVGKLDPARGKRLVQAEGVYLNVHTSSSGADSLDNLLALKALVESGKVKPVIDRCYPLDQIAEAHRYVERGHKKGSVAITV